MGDDLKTNVALVIERIEEDPRAAEELLPLVYGELRRLAQAWLANESPGQTLQPTALVHEAYLRLLGTEPTDWQGRRHFFGAAALAMRRILVEQARRKARLRHGGGRRREQLFDVEWADKPPSEDIMDLDEALSVLEAEDPRKGQIVNLRYFAGMTAPETAEVLGVSLSTIEREWRYIRRWLFNRLHEGREGGKASPHGNASPK